MIIVCYSKCTPCQFGQCPDEPHTWMESEDIEHDKSVKYPRSVEDWAELGRIRPCGCPCMAGRKSDLASAPPTG